VKPVQIAIIAALPREIAALVRGHAADRDLRRGGLHLYRLPQAIVVAAGMGAQRATLAVQAALAAAPISTLISAGLAGACSSTLRPGDVVEPGTIIDANTGERFTADAPVEMVLVTMESVAGIDEKSRLAATYTAALVDMEAAAVARLAQANALRFRAVKAISDGHDFELPELNRFTGLHGSFRTGAFALHVALRPRLWSKSAQLGRESNRALAALTERLRTVLREGS
jgi:adenosylhomocysteine nucleosidase